MPRNKHLRRVGPGPRCPLFKPAGIPSRDLEELVLELDELESIRLADLEGLYQDQAAERMHVSRATFGRIVASARGKIARALVEGLAIRIEGGPVMVAGGRLFRCFGCGHRWEEARGTGRPEACPSCESDTFGRESGGGGGRGRGRGRGGHGRGSRE